LALRPEHFIHIGISRRVGDAPRWARIAGEGPGSGADD
jgi:hypothetical protein